MKRTRSGKRIELTERDLAIFRLLRQYRYLRSTYIHAFVGGASETRLKERLGDLFHEGYLDRPSKQWEFADGRHRPAVHDIGAGAVRALREAGGTYGDARTFLSEAAHRQFQHSLMICEVLASLDLAIRADPLLRFIAWPEMLARAPEATRQSPAPFRLPVPSGGFLVPDGLFGIEYRGGDIKAYRFFALEADRGTMPVARSTHGQSSYLAKLARYREVLQNQIFKTHLRLPNLIVLTVTEDPDRLASIIGSMIGPEPTFLFKHASASNLASPMRSLLQTAWQRAGLAPLAIDTP